MRRAKEEQEKREEEEYLKLKASFTVEDQGEEEQLTEDQVTSLLSSHHLNIPFLLSLFKQDTKCFLSSQSRNLLQEFIQYIEVRADTHTPHTPPCAEESEYSGLNGVSVLQSSKVVLLEDLASHFGMRTQDAIARLQDLLAEGSLTG